MVYPGTALLFTHFWCLNPSVYQRRLAQRGRRRPQKPQRERRCEDRRNIFKFLAYGDKKVGLALAFSSRHSGCVLERAGGLSVPPSEPSVPTCGQDTQNMALCLETLQGQWESSPKCFLDPVSQVWQTRSPKLGWSDRGRMGGCVSWLLSRAGNSPDWEGKTQHCPFRW